MEIYKVSPQTLRCFRMFAKAPAKAAKELSDFMANNLEILSGPTDAYKATLEQPLKNLDQDAVFALLDALAPYVYEILSTSDDADEVAQGLALSAQRMARNSVDGPLSDAGLKRLRANLLAVFDNGSLRIKAKALRLLNSHERSFMGCEIYSDIRPIFKVGGDIAPEAAVVYHTLRIKHSASEGLFAVSMDSHDLRDLKLAVERAIKKEEALSKLIGKTGLQQIKVS